MTAPFDFVVFKLNQICFAIVRNIYPTGPSIYLEHTPNINMMSAGAAEASAVVAETNKMMDLTEKLDKSACYARNESSQYPFTNLFIGDSRIGCKSDADEQLIIHVAFNEHVKVS